MAGLCEIGHVRIPAKARGDILLSLYEYMSCCTGVDVILTCCGNLMLLGNLLNNCILPVLGLLWPSPAQPLHFSSRCLIKNYVCDLEKICSSRALHRFFKTLVILYRYFFTYITSYACPHFFEC